MRSTTILCLLTLLALLLAPAALLSLSTKRNTADVHDVVRHAVANHLQRETVRNDYTYLARVRWTDFVARGKSKPRYTETYEIMFLEGAPYSRHIAHNGRPLPADQEKLEEGLLQAEAKARRAETNRPPGRLLGYEQTSQSTWTLQYLTTEFNLHEKGTSVLNGRQVQIVEARPREKPEHLETARDYARHFKTTLWIDVTEQQIIRAKEELIEDNLVMTQPGLTIAYPVTPEDPQISESGKGHITYPRGSVFMIQWTKVNGEAWLPQTSYSKFKATVVFERPAGELTPRQEFRRDLETTYSDYKKFRVKSRIIP